MDFGMIDDETDENQDKAILGKLDVVDVLA
jgi:hypothetical protein